MTFMQVLSLVMFFSVVSFLVGFAIGFASSPDGEVKDV